MRSFCCAVADLVRVGLHLPSRGAHRPYLHLSRDQGPRLSPSKEVEHAQPPVAASLGTHQRKRLWRERPLALKGHPHPAVTPLSVICGSSTLAVPIVSNRCLGSAAGACLGRLSIFGAISSSLSSFGGAGCNSAFYFRKENVSILYEFPQEGRHVLPGCPDDLEPIPSSHHTRARVHSTLLEKTALSVSCRFCRRRRF